MHARQLLATTALIALLLAAGCVAVPSSVGDDSTGLTSESAVADGWSTTVHDRDGSIGRSASVRVDGELPVDATRTFRRVELLLGEDASVPRVEAEPREATGRWQLEPSNSLEALGFTNASGDYRECGTIGSGSATDETVTISTVDPTTGERMSDDAIELVLAHEFAHVVQQQWTDQRVDEVEVQPGEEETEPRSQVVTLGMREGFAVAVAESYAREYGLRWDGQRPMELRACLYQESRNALGMISASYYFGGHYYLKELDGTGELLGGMESPPRTTEQLLHPETRGDEPPMPLSVDAAENPQWRTDEQFGLLGSPAGEATLRVWLRSALDRDRADAAATGWGNGTTVTYVAGDGGDGAARRYGAVWALRWDTRADATEFETAAREASGPIANRANTSLSVERVAPDTVIVAGGPASFVDGLEATASNGSITLAPPGEAGAAADG